MGAVYGNDPDHPSAAPAVLGDFRFFAGAPAPALARFQPERRRSALFIPLKTALDGPAVRCIRLSITVHHPAGHPEKAHL